MSERGFVQSHHRSFPREVTEGTKRKKLKAPPDGWVLRKELVTSQPAKSNQDALALSKEL